MFTFLIISNEENIFASVHRAFSTIGVPEHESGSRLFVEGAGGMKDGWVAFPPIHAEHDYGTEELVEIKKQIVDPSFYLVEGRDGPVSLSNLFVQEFNPLGWTLVDNNHGMLVGLAEVRRKIDSGKDWLHSPIWENEARTLMRSEFVRRISIFGASTCSRSLNESQLGSYGLVLYDVLNTNVTLSQRKTEGTTEFSSQHEMHRLHRPRFRSDHLKQSI